MRKLTSALAATLLGASMAVAAMASGVPAARAEDNGVGLTPAMGWSSWSFIRSHPTAAKIEAQAKAMADSGLASVGYQYVNLDDFWYICPGSQGPDVDQYGRWVPDPAKFPPSGSENGIQAVADYVHSLGLKFGLYVTPGISDQAVAQNTPIEGTPYTADEIADGQSENNYNCHGMQGIDYSKPGAQQFIDSWADEFASWGVDYLKLDGVGSFDIPDVQAWSQALQQTGRPIHLELSNSLNINDASTWEQYSNGWRTGGDIECYGCEQGGSSYPLTDWSNVEGRFNQVAEWQPYGEPGAFNDYDSTEVGNGANDGLTYTERQTQLSLWALASAPLILGTDLTNLDPTDLGLLKNTAVISVDQDAIDASRINDTATSQIFAKTEKTGDVVVGLFNTGSVPETISTTASALGLAPGTDYLLNDLWTNEDTESAGTISATVPSHGVALFRVSPLNNPTTAPPDTALAVTGPSVVTPGLAVTETDTFTDDGELPAQHVNLGLQAPTGWSVTPTSPTSFGAVESGQTVQATFQVVAPQPAAQSETDTLTGTAGYTWPGGTSQGQVVPESVVDEVPYASLAAAFDNVGISNDTDTAAANVDGDGSSFSAQALASVGVTPGASLTFDGITFTWPDVPAGQPDNVVGSGQTIDLSGSGADLGLLDTAVYGPATGTGTIIYTDGSTQSFSLSVPDWYKTAPAGSNAVITAPYRNRPKNAQDHNAVNVFEQSIPLQAGKTVKAVMLPDVSSGVAQGSPSLHVWAMAIGG